MIIRVYYLEVFERNLDVNFKINVAGELNWLTDCRRAGERCASVRTEWVERKDK